MFSIKNTSVGFVILSSLLVVNFAQNDEDNLDLNAMASEKTYPYYQDQLPADQVQLPAENELQLTTTRQKGRKRKLKLRRNRNRIRNRNRYRYVDKPYSDYDYENYQTYNQDRDGGGYKAPSSGYNAPSSGYNAPSSNYGAPSSSYGAPSYGGGKDDGFNDFLNALAAFLPIGLFLAAIPPNLITISTGRRRKRDEQDIGLNEIESVFDSERPFMNWINSIGFKKLRESTECQKRLFCEMSRYGGERGNANSVQKVFHLLSTLLADLHPSFMDDSNYFDMVRSGNCNLFKCSRK